MEFKTIENPNKVIDCYFCRRDLRLEDFILCEECQYEICPNCFANGCQAQKHLRTHDYRIIQKLDQEIFEPNWSVHQELIFLQGIQMLGYANWEEIAKKIDKSPAEIERHFKLCYENFFTGELKEDLHKRKQEIDRQRNSGMTIEFEPLIDRIKATLNQNNIIKQAEERKLKFNPDKKLIFGDILGYMPLRGDFDIEYENEAEILLSEMQFKDNEPEEDLKIKYSILQIYNRRLIERQKRKEFLISRNKLDFEANFLKEKAMTKMERDIRNNLKKYERFQTEEEHEQLVQCLIQEIENKEMVDNLLAIQANGCKTLEEFENMVFNKSEIKKEKKFLNNLPSLRQNFSKRKTAYKFNKNNTLESFLSQKQNSIFSQEELKTIYYEETELCQKLNISYDDYNQIKECLVNESIMEYFVDRSKFISQYQYVYDRKIFDEIFDFLKRKDIVLEKEDNQLKFQLINSIIQQSNGLRMHKDLILNFQLFLQTQQLQGQLVIQYAIKSFMQKSQKNSQIQIIKKLIKNLSQYT